ncbi:MAG: MYXO-CTERM sorting domain-containing protein, partial [Polyangiaceae bacterium]
FILYNRLTDEAGTEASYEIDLPNGGTSYIIGNLIEQSDAGNDNIINTGEEGASNPTQVIYLVNNTIVNDHSNGTFLNVTGATATLVNNIFKGPGTITNASGATMSNNWDDTMGDPMLVDVASYDYHLAAGSPCVDKGKDPGAGPDMSLDPVFEYVHPTNAEGRVVAGSAIDIGAYELGGGVPLGDGGLEVNPGGDGGASGGGGDGGNLPGDAVSPNGGSNDSGCGCVAASRNESGFAWLASLAVIAMTWRRRRAAKSSK